LAQLSAPRAECQYETDRETREQIPETRDQIQDRARWAYLVSGFWFLISGLFDTCPGTDIHHKEDAKTQRAKPEEQGGVAPFEAAE
jgi:hypothetical protein